jgi:methyl coenzyme M reductase subunit C-like uncharacterized protein (methanogenesis marker protein 7)
MTDVTTKLYQTKSDGVVYSDPADAGFMVRFKSTSAQKSLSGVAVTNKVTEVIINDDNAITVSGVGATDALSVRLRVSGSVESVDRLAEILSGLASQINTWVSEDVLLGFSPSTAPINRTS